MRSAYGRTIPPEDATLTHVGPGTPAGELLRRYWQPVGVSAELHDLPRRVRLLGEDLVLFRDGQGRVGLLELHCSHRGTSLEWGRVEEQGLRCCYHGWLFDVNGRVCDMLCEPVGTAQRLGVEHPAYPVLEFGGLIFAYMGPPEQQPLLPMYDIYDTSQRHDITIRGMRLWDDYGIGYVRDCSWLQHLENVVDPWHLVALHTLISGAQFAGAMGLAQQPEISFEETALGVRYRLLRTLPNGNQLERYAEIVFPNIALIPNIYEKGDAPVSEDKASEVTWVVPVDDTQVIAYSLVAVPLVDGAPDPHFQPRTHTETRDAAGNIIRPGAIRDRPYENRQRYPDDMEAQEGQRPIAIHALERLVSSDRGVILYRRLLRQQIARLQEGHDPLNIVRQASANQAIPTHAFNTVRTPVPTT